MKSGFFWYLCCVIKLKKDYETKRKSCVYIDFIGDFVDECGVFLP